MSVITWDLFTWDLRTGGIVSVIRGEGHDVLYRLGAHITYSTDGKMVSILLRYWSSTTISIYEVISGAHMHDVDHLALGTPYVYKIWTHGESLRFATPGPTAITIWEVGFAQGTTPMEVEAISIPVNAIGMSVFKPRKQSDVAWSEFHPASYRLAFVAAGGTLLVWDARASRFLLHHPDVDPHCSMSFSSDGRFFVCTTGGPEVNLWKESPTGYTLVTKVTTGTPNSRPRLSPNGESIITLSIFTIRLWHTKHFNTTILSQAPGHADDNFILEFLPNKPFVVAARRNDKTVTVLDLKSGIPQLTIEASIGIYGLKSIENTIIVIGDNKAICWDLRGRDFRPDARMNIGDSTRIINFDIMNSGVVTVASISSDLRYIALARYGERKGFGGDFLEVYCTSTGLTTRRDAKVFALSFTPDGHDLWCSSGDTVDVFTVTPRYTGTVLGIGDGSWGGRSPWEPPRGYKVTDDGWILDADGKRLLMLPPLLRSQFMVDRVWNGDFLALLHGQLPQPVILELGL